MTKTIAASSRKRLALTFGAQIYNQFVTIAVQLSLIPVLLHFWGTERYGVWLLLAAVPTYLVFADFGFTLSAKNELTTSIVHGDEARAVSIYQSTFALLNVVITVVIGILLASLSAADLTTFFSLGEVQSDTAKLVLLTLSGNVLLNQYLLLFAAGLRAVGRPAEEVIWNASARLAEGVATAVAASQSEDIFTAALAILLCRTIIAAAVWLRLSFLAPWLQLGLSRVSRAEIRRLAAPSFAFLAQSFAQILLIQGPVILLGSLANPVTVATFSTCRTLVRLGTTGANLLNATFLPEYTRLYSTNRPLLWKAFRWHVFAALSMIIAYIAVLNVLGEYILGLWTKNHIHAGFPWFSLLVVAAALEMAWTTLVIPVLAINRHMVPSYAYLAVSIISVVALAACIETFGMDAVGMSLLIAHAAMVAVVVADLRKQVGSEIKTKS